MRCPSLFIPTLASLLILLSSVSLAAQEAAHALPVVVELGRDLVKFVEQVNVFPGG